MADMSHLMTHQVKFSNGTWRCRVDGHKLFVSLSADVKVGDSFRLNNERVWWITAIDHMVGDQLQKISFSASIRPTTAAEFDAQGYPLTSEGWLEVQERDREALIHILWRSGMPGWTPIYEDHPDWASYIADAEKIIEGKWRAE